MPKNFPLKHFFIFSLLLFTPYSLFAFEVGDVRAFYAEKLQKIEAVSQYTECSLGSIEETQYFFIVYYYCVYDPIGSIESNFYHEAVFKNHPNIEPTLIAEEFEYEDDF